MEEEMKWDEKKNNSEALRRVSSVANKTKQNPYAKQCTINYHF